MKKFKKPIIIGIIAFIIITIGILGTYFSMLRPVSNTSEAVVFVINRGDSGATVANNLEEAGLIRSTTLFRWHLRASNQPPLAGTYQLDKNMNLLTIIEHLTHGTNLNNLTLVIPEGRNVRAIAKIISDTTNNTEEDVFSLLADNEYIAELVNQYWFLTDEIQNPDLHYPLEGYLFPNTYMLANEDVTVKEIFAKMLTETDRVLTKYQDQIENLDMTVHEFLTLAAIVQAEGRAEEDFTKIAAVFHRRLEINMPLGSCPTTFYAIGVDMAERELTRVELNTPHPFNTRAPGAVGLPVGPITNPGEEALKATLDPDPTPYLFFVSDKNFKTHFTTTYEEHRAKRQELRDAGLWHEW